MKSYTKEYTKEILFPVGGIGAGSIGLSGNGMLRDWEICNHPNRKTSNGFSHILVRAESNGAVIDTRVLQGDWQGAAIGGETEGIYRGNGGWGFGMGPYRGTMAGVPHFENHQFYGEYPFAQIEFEDRSFPGNVKLKAFNPFIPLNDKDSSLPSAFYEVEFNNDTDEIIDYTAMFTVNNPLPFGMTKNSFKLQEGFNCIKYGCEGLDENSLLWGELCLATDCTDVSWQEYWYRAEWFDSLETFWGDVNKGGKLVNRHYDKPSGRNNDDELRLDGEENGTLAAHCTLKPGEKKSVRFNLSWFFPNCSNTWNPENKTDLTKQWENYYTKLVSGAEDCAKYCLKNWKKLYSDTKLFKDTIYHTSLPDYCLEAVTANMSILKTTTCLRLENGEFYGFEGSGMDEGVCEGSCSHVWNYAYALPFLFPKLERSMRDLDFQYNQREDGAMSFRLMLPLGRERFGFRPCVDGQMGGVIKTWRDYLLCGDKDWLAKNWIGVKKSIEFAWAQTNEDGWDLNQDGVLEGRQHHTMDMELFGPSSWLNGFYVAALLAGSKIADELGHEEESDKYFKLYLKGKNWINSNLYNGEYFIQKIDLTDESLLDKYDNILSYDGFTAKEAYWNEETGEIKYQIANGCATDQVIAQWHANLCNLGEVFDEEKTISALKSIYKYNKVDVARDTFCSGRVYALDDDGYVKICGWPQNVEQPSVPLTYAEEVFCGLEYQVAAHMIQEGLLEKGFSIVKQVRDRFDGEKRNPWNEFECGNNYARSMASFSLIPSISGFSYNLSKDYIGFDPKKIGEMFHSFFCVETGWGEYSENQSSIELQIFYGNLSLKELGVPKETKVLKVMFDNKVINFEIKNDRMIFDTALQLDTQKSLRIFKK